MKVILTPDRLSTKEISLLGGKGKRLLDLSNSGYRVPRWFAISSAVFDRICSGRRYRRVIKETLDSTDFRKAESVGSTSARLQELIRNASVEESVWRNIIGAYRRYFSTDEHLAVRSSAGAEDGLTHSFAGQLRSYLFVSGETDLVGAIRGCWESVFSVRMLTYHFLNRIRMDPSTLRVAVVVQRMIPATVSGVMFTADPLSGQSEAMVISANPGIGTAVASGQTNPDTFRVNRVTMDLEQDIRRKSSKITLNTDSGSGITSICCSEEEACRPSLTPSQVRELAEIGISIERKLGRPQDIEWAFDADGVHLLQTRPITALPPSTVDCRPIIWDNSSTLESYSGVTLPLTFSFVREAYSVIYRQAAQMAGVSRKTISDNEHTFENMIGLIRGHMYYSLNSWYQTLSLLPGFDYSKRFMEHLGVKESAQLTLRTRHSSWIRKCLDLPRFARMMVHMLYYAQKGDSLASSLVEKTDAVCSEYENRLLTTSELPELIVTYRDAGQKLLGDWKATIVNDFLVAVFFGLLRRLTATLEVDGADNLTNDLLRGQSGMLSTEPVKSIVLMADTIRNDQSLRDLVERTTDEELCRLLLDESASGQLALQFRQHLDRYGYRCVNELKFEETTLRDNPKALLTIIRSYMARPGLDFATIQARGEDARQRAEELIRSRLGRRLLVFPNPKYLFFYWVLLNTRRHIRHRDNMRFARARVFSLFRDIFSAMGTKMRETGFLDDAGDIFYLEVSDIVAYSTGVLPGADLQGLARCRKQAFQRYREDEPLPDRFNAADLLAGRGGCASEKARTVSGNESQVLRGSGCSAGFAEGPARIVASPSDDGLLPGDILVAREMDPGWITLFPLASGILIERGSTLSHCAIVARELGVPTIVGIEGLTSKVRSGQWLTLDGAKGAVTIDTAVNARSSPPGARGNIQDAPCGA